MANEVVLVEGSQKTLEANGASTANDVVSEANDATYSVSSDGGGFPHALFVLRLQFATITSVQNKTVNLYARPLDIDGTSDSDAPESGANFKGRFIGAFVINAQSANTNEFVEIQAFDLPRVASYWIDNQTGQTISAGWTLKVTPFSYKPGA